ncbi:hypothetical protein IFM89_005904 [Coptis chinensis]|uniref:Uncharacterized protein n=1 Tax=Coptis chinensis TaxID=261450 RepID=A0A835HU22_9MAGN|nr:hypothetical protein IFM89_005904 [Coptis chinensis]
MATTRNENNPQKQLLTLIRDFATEKSQGERRVAGLKKRIEELRSTLDLTNEHLEESKGLKESAEQELKGFEVELSLNDSSILAQQSRICLIQEEISKIGSQVEALKTEERIHRDDFINQMVEFNKMIRPGVLHQVHGRSFVLVNRATSTVNFLMQKISRDNSLDSFIRMQLVVTGDKVEDKQTMLDVQVALNDLEDKLELITSQTHKQEVEYQENQDKQTKVQQELVDWEKNASFIKAVVKETKELQELTRYPFLISRPNWTPTYSTFSEDLSLTLNTQTAESEETCAALGEELQRRCACPSCHLDNIGALGGILEADQEC